MNKELFFDCETTGLPPKGAKWDTDFAKFPFIVQLSWYYQGEYYDRIIKPDGYEIPVESTKIHGISTSEALAKGVDLKTVLDEFMGHALLSHKVIAHSVYFDTSVIKANTMRLQMRNFMNLMSDALYKDKRVCTMLKTIKFVGAKNERGGIKWPTLTELYDKLFPSETFKAHNSLEDVKAMIRCYQELVKREIIQ